MQKIKSKFCQFVGCEFPIFSNGFCKFHQTQRTDPKWLNRNSGKGNISKSSNIPSGRISKDKFNYKFQPIAKESQSRAVINRLYESRGRIFRAEKKICEVCPVIKAAGIKIFCSGKAEAVHHTRGKATTELLLKEEWWLASCFWGNGWVEDNSEKALQLGLKAADYTSKLSKFKG